MIFEDTGYLRWNELTSYGNNKQNGFLGEQMESKNGWKYRWISLDESYF